VRTIVVVTFAEPSKAYQAFSLLKELNEHEALHLRSAVVVERLADGQPVVHDYADPVNLVGDPRELIDTLVNGLAGLTDLASIASTIPFASTAVIAELDEYTVEVIDNAMADLGGAVFRESTRAVRAELSEAKARRRQVEKQARQDEREAHRREGEREWVERHNALIRRAPVRLEKQQARIPPPTTPDEATVRR
jgi:uncharacterized membrane protein